MNDLLMYIDQIDQSISDAEINVLESMIQTYDKSIIILEECEDPSVFGDIFQEGEKWDKFKEDTKAPVFGKKGEGFVKRLLMIIPRLIQKLIALISRLFKKNKDYKKQMDKDINELKNEANKMVKGSSVSDEEIQKTIDKIKEAAPKDKSTENIHVQSSEEIRKMLDNMKPDETLYFGSKGIEVVKASSNNTNENAPSSNGIRQYMSPDMKKWIKDRNVENIRNSLWMNMASDPLLFQHQDTIKQCGNWLYDTHKELVPFTDDKSKWTKGHWNRVYRDLDSNFSKERLAYLMKIAPVAVPADIAEKKARLAKKNKEFHEKDSKSTTPGFVQDLLDDLMSVAEKEKQKRIRNGQRYLQLADTRFFNTGYAAIDGDESMFKLPMINTYNGSEITSLVEELTTDLKHLKTKNIYTMEKINEILTDDLIPGMEEEIKTLMYHSGGNHVTMKFDDAIRCLEIMKKSMQAAIDDCTNSMKMYHNLMKEVSSVISNINTLEHPGDDIIKSLEALKKLDETLIKFVGLFGKYNNRIMDLWTRHKQIVDEALKYHPDTEYIDVGVYDFD